jgi:hypothetical protein
VLANRLQACSAAVARRGSSSCLPTLVARACGPGRGPDGGCHRNGYHRGAVLPGVVEENAVFVELLGPVAVVALRDKDFGIRIRGSLAVQLSRSSETDGRRIESGSSCGRRQRWRRPGRPAVRFFPRSVSEIVSDLLQPSPQQAD